jgi:hypothetical protein
MTEMRRSEENPILIPISENKWEAEGAFNEFTVGFTYIILSRCYIK